MNINEPLIQEADYHYFVVPPCHESKKMSQKLLGELLRISFGANHVTDKQIDKLVGASDAMLSQLELCINSPRSTIRETWVVQQVGHK